jgi:hypothetical protein
VHPGTEANAAIQPRKDLGVTCDTTYDASASKDTFATIIQSIQDVGIPIDAFTIPMGWQARRWNYALTPDVTALPIQRIREKTT